QSVGLQYTSPGKAGFLASSCVIIVPILMAILYKVRITPSIATGSIICFVGLALLSLTENFTLQWGDFLEILCALFFSIQTIVIYRYAQEIHPIRMAIVQTLVAGVICLVISLITEPMPGIEIVCMPVVISIGYGVIFCTIVTFIIQGYAQKITPPSHVSILLSFEAVFALILSVIIGFEEFTTRSLFGCVVLFIGFMITQIKLPWK
ncbi:MAG: DMT family transporter, partial [Lachnospiraceae bacterium]